MKINNNPTNINFKQLFPTRELLKVATSVGIAEVDSKAICKAYGNKFVGCRGYHNTAKNIVNSILSKDKNIKEIVDLLNTQEDPKKLKAIEQYVEQIGSHIDIEI